MEGGPLLPMPRSWILFTCASLVGATALLVISMLDLGYLSLWANPCVSVYTIMYHAGVIFIARRKRDPDHPSYFSTVILSGYFLALLWGAALFMSIIVILSPNSNGLLLFLQQHGLPVTRYAHIAQPFLALYQLIMVAGMSIWGHLVIVARHGPDPPDWRYEAAYQSDVESVISMYSQPDSLAYRRYGQDSLGDMA